MCGLAGYFLWEEVAAPPLEEALRLLRHRGPDAQRLWHASHGKVGLAHTRLSILDLSENAHQPFEAQGIWLVYNGEIYNFRQLAQQRNWPLRTRSDTEVIVYAYLEWGEAFLERLEGMFAFALYDSRAHRLLLARDPFGIKPLWVAQRPEGLYFASELKVLRTWLKPLTQRPEAVAEFLHLGFIPAPHSWYKGISKVQPGEVWRISAEGISQHLYYDRTQLWHQPFSITTLPKAKVLVKAELRRAVEEHLVSDVPVGVFLSGGTDSSLVAALAREVGGELTAFTIGFAEAKYNELPYAQAVARHLGLRHFWEVLSAAEAARWLTELPQWYDEPFGDISAIPTYLVSRLAARFVKVVLAGDGGDELYWGYGRYRWAARLARLRGWWRWGSVLLAQMPSARLRRVAHLLRLPYAAPTEHIFSQEQYTFSWAEVQRLLPEGPPPWQAEFALPSDARLRQVALDFLIYLPDDLLTKVDRASMQHGLEVRVPLLDKRFVALSWQVASALKRPRGYFPVQYKPLLRAILSEYLPPALVRRRKWGFALPLAQWLRGPLAEWARTYTQPTLLESAYGLRGKEVAQLWHRFGRGEAYLATRLWLLAQLGQFAAYASGD
ncbi:MAG: asparagine synthase (glutamine-hydrolyzing) [Bacteroidia bacterium]